MEKKKFDTDLNKIHLCGTLKGSIEYDHMVRAANLKMYKFQLMVERTNGNFDILPIMASEQVIPEPEKFQDGDRMEVHGFISTLYNTDLQPNNKSRLLVFVMAKSVYDIIDKPDINEVQLHGRLFSMGPIRDTPVTQSHICDFSLTVKNRNREVHVPCIAWGSTAIWLNKTRRTGPNGDMLNIHCRFQSREYEKTLEDGTKETRVAYECSCHEITPLDAPIEA